jgi:hypothetical protein
MITALSIQSTKSKSSEGSEQNVSDTLAGIIDKTLNKASTMGSTVKSNYFEKELEREPAIKQRLENIMKAMNDEATRAGALYWYLNMQK